jgi:hypothetical protein
MGASSPQAARIMRLTVGDKLGHASIRRFDVWIPTVRTVIEGENPLITVTALELANIDVPIRPLDDWPSRVLSGIAGDGG